MNVTTTYFIISVALVGTLCEPARASEDLPTIEMFTDSRIQVVSHSDNTTVYTIDRIEQFQKELSSNLPSNPAAAKKVALQRFQSLDGQLSRELENAAKGLLLALQYSIDRYPAIVFDGEAVVYGISDINVATRLYHQWQTEGAQP